MMNTGQTNAYYFENAYYLAGGVCYTFGLVEILGSYYPSGSLDSRKEMFYRGMLFTLLGSACVLEPKFGVASLVKQAAIRFWLSPTNATVLILEGVIILRHYARSGNPRELLDHFLVLWFGSVMAATQLALFILTNKNS